MTIRSEAAKGRVEGLTALRDRLADALDDPSSTDVRSLSAVAGQLRKTLEEIESLTDEPAEDSPLERLRRERAERLASIPGKRSGRVS
jgi:hypothetical protein